MSEMSTLRRVLTEPFRLRTWTEIGYALVGLPIGIAGFVFTVATVTVSAGLAITFVGLPLLALTGLLSRWFGSVLRRFANVCTGADVPRAQPFRAQPGLFGWLSSCLQDGTAWRSRAYLLLRLPVGILGFVTSTVFLAYGLGAVTYPIWRPFLPCNTSSDGVCHHGAGLTSTVYLDSPLLVTATFVVGVVFTFAAPWAVRGVLKLDSLLVRLLLGPLSGSSRVAELERSRAVAVDDSAATLRRIERDLHDGAQAKLVAVAMNVGRAREKVAAGGDPSEAARLLDAAHVTAKEAIVELRDLARGIHPPVLDAGLDAALATLAAHSTIPVDLRTELSERPEPAIETMAYFCAAELLTNAAKHSGARHITVTARTPAGRLRLDVRDDGRGGAAIGAGSGLAGLTDRVGTVDGTLTIDSPAGGPTIVSVDVPLRAGRTTP